MLINENYPVLSVVILSLVSLTVGCALLNRQWYSPILSILVRWLRVLTFSQLFTFFCLSLGWDQYSLVSLQISGLLIWFLFESFFQWMWIKAFSFSDIPLFPSYVAMKEMDFWPAHPRFLKTKDWLKANGFSKIKALQMKLHEGLEIKSLVFYNEERTIRVQVMFFPTPSGNFSSSIIFHSETESGQYLMTDNINVPFGGFYPDDWEVKRLPWQRKIVSLFAQHQKQIANASLKTLDEDVLDAINSMQKELEALNFEVGFLHDRSEHEEYGKISDGGRYRVWKELFFLNYFGRSIL